jgi:hypothetical protein
MNTYKPRRERMARFRRPSRAHQIMNHPAWTTVILIAVGFLLLTL